jgi:hypothetical protein
MGIIFSIALEPDDATKSLLGELIEAGASIAASNRGLTAAVELLTKQLDLRSARVIVIAGPFSLPGLIPTPGGDPTMPAYLLPNNQADNAYSLPTINLKDTEDEPITTGITETFDSTDPDVVSILNNGDPHDPAGMVHFGHSGVANLNHVVSYQGQPVYSKSINVTLTTSGVATVDASGEFGLPGLTPVDTPAPESA